MPIIDATDLATYMGRDVENAAAATSIIDGLEGDLEAYLKRPIVPTVITDEAVEVVGAGIVYTKATPIVSVQAFTLDGVAIAADQYNLQPFGLRDFWGFFPSPLVNPAPVLLLSYTAGLPGDDPTTAFGRKARAVLLRAAARDYNQVVREDLAGVARASIEGTSLEFHGGVRAGAGGLTQDERLQFERWKKRIVRR